MHFDKYLHIALGALGFGFTTFLGSLATNGGVVNKTSLVAAATTTLVAVIQHLRPSPLVDNILTNTLGGTPEATPPACGHPLQLPRVQDPNEGQTKM